MIASMRRFVETCEAVSATTKKTEKVRLVSKCLRSLPVDDAAQAAIFFAGHAFPRWEERTLAVGGSLIWQALEALSGLPPERLSQTYRRYGDAGGMAEEVLSSDNPGGELTLRDVAATFENLAALRGSTQKLEAFKQLLRRAGPGEAKYIIKIVTGDLRIGLKENLVEEAIAQTFLRPLDLVRRANMITADVGATFRLAAADDLAAARLRLFHPIGFMLATPAETPAEVFESFPADALVEDKYDGIRAQAHKSGRTVKLFSRTMDELLEFPELFEGLAALPGEFILDGEILAWRDAHPLPFRELQRRLGRKHPDMWLLLDIPVNFVAFDLLYQDGDLLLDTPLRERQRRLEQLLGPAPGAHFQLAGSQRCQTVEELRETFENAILRGQEGLMAKEPGSPYSPGHRGRFWFKLKQPLATLDVVVTAVEYGHGKRHRVLSDYTFAVRDAGRLLNIGKAYAGLTDAEIREYTDHFLKHTVEDRGHWRRVEPNVVLEIAFNNIQRSDRHESGYALRFPRIVRLRPDKTLGEIDTLERVKEIYAGQRAGTPPRD